MAKKKVKKKAAKKKAVKKKTTKAVAKAKPPVKLSKQLSKDVTEFILQKTNITAANKQLDAMKSEASKLEATIMGALEEMGQTGAMVKAGTVKFKEKDVFNAKDWPKIYAHILKTKDFGLLQKRLSSALLKEYFDDGKKIKGVDHFMKSSLSHSAAKKI